MSFISSLKFKILPNKSYRSAIVKVDQRYKKQLSSTTSSIEYQNLCAESSFVITSLYDEWESVKTIKIINKAIKYDLPIHPKPVNQEENEYWRWSPFGHILTAVGRSELRKLIQQERSIIRDKVSFYSAILFGLLGLIIGLLGVIN